MKQMKQIVLTITLLLFSVIVFSQTTPIGQFRIQDRTTAFGQNLPAGTQVYVMSDSTLWQTKAALAKTATINSSIGDLALINNQFNYFVEQFEATSTSTTYSLTYLPKVATTGVAVTMNGAALRPTIDYTTSGKTLTIVTASGTYDLFVVSYTYYR